MSTKAKVKEVPAKKKDKEKIEKKKTKQTHKPKVEKTSPGQYLREVRLELKKVAWPSRPEVVTFTIIVIVMVVIFGLYTFALDISFQKLLQVSTELVR